MIVGIKCLHSQILTTQMIMNRYLAFCLFIVLMLSSIGVFGLEGDSIRLSDNNARAADSLIRELKSAGVNQKIKIYRNLADIYFETPMELHYLREMYNQASKISDASLKLDILGDITFIHINNNNVDSAYYYISIIEKTASAEESVGWLSYLRMRLFDVDKVVPEMNDVSNLYYKIENAYIIGSGLMIQDKLKEALPYLKTSYELSFELPEKESYKFKTTTAWLLAKCSLQERDIDNMIKVIETVINERQSYYDKYYKAERPFYDINARLVRDYSFVLSSFKSLSQDKIDFYLKKLLDLTENTTRLSDKYSRYITLNNYYLYKRDYKTAQIANDSLIKLAYKIAPYNLPFLYEVSYLTYEAMGKYKEALESMQMFVHTKDSLLSQENQAKVNELQVRYDVDKLKYEKSQLEVKSKRILLICLLVVLCGVAAACLYLWLNLKKEKHLKNKLYQLNIKAGESERMKSAFINSICHEIRTPLNAIVGFSSLILDESSGLQTRSTFHELIQKNAFLLTSLIENMFEVASLDSSQNKLPCENVELHPILIKEINRVKEFAKLDIEYLLDIPQDNIMISTHAKYLGLVIGELLDNANKFTERGYIKLGYNVNDASGDLNIVISDTGCGIPVEKHDSVFERFVKLDDFTQGNGLGLYLCQLIMTRLGGNVYIDKEYNNGSRFVITLPL